jgi:cytochrome c5
MKSLLKFVSLSLILRGLLACQHSTMSVIEPTVKEPLDSCGVNNISYKTKIETVFTAHCYGCHSGTGASKGIDLEGYASLKWWMSNDSSRLLGVIRRGEMPPKGKIPNCQIQQIEAWLRKGMPL